MYAKHSAIIKLKTSATNIHKIIRSIIDLLLCVYSGYVRIPVIITKHGRSNENINISFSDFSIDTNT